MNLFFDNIFPRRQRTPQTSKPSALTFDHDHVDVDGADRRLRESLSFLQDACDLIGGDPVIRLRPERHQLPNGHTSRDNHML